MADKLLVTTSPHLKKTDSVSMIMWMVFLALIPSGIASLFIYGRSVIGVMAVSIAAAVATEAALQLLTRQKVTITDGSAALTGLLLAYNLSPSVPLWLSVAGAVFAVAIGKQIFGGLGKNIFNPALAGRVFLMASWPQYMTTFTQPLVPFLKQNPFGAYDAVTSATPLMLLKEGKLAESVPYLDLLFGNRGGCIGEACIIALLIGAAFLLWKKYISWHIPFSFIATVGVFTYLFGPSGLLSGDWLFYILSGGLILGAFFMATDYVTSPLTYKGKLIFGFGCGLLTFIIRRWGGYPEGVSYSILMMNAVTPLIDRYTRLRIYGTSR